MSQQQQQNPQLSQNQTRLQNLSTISQPPHSDHQPERQLQYQSQGNREQSNIEEQVPQSIANYPTQASPLRHANSVQPPQDAINREILPHQISQSRSDQPRQEQNHQHQQVSVPIRNQPRSQHQLQPQFPAISASLHPTDDDINSFIIAIKSGFIQQINSLLQKFGKDIVNRVQPQTRQPSLYFAAILSDEQTSLTIMKSLIQHGANALFKDQHQQSIMFYVCREGHTKCMDYLLEKGVPIDEEDVYGQIPLYYAVSENRTNIVSKFEDKALFNHKDKLAGQTPLFYAARKGHMQTCRLLIEKGCDPTIHDSHNKLATQYARKAKYPQIADYLAQQVKKARQSNKIASMSQVEQQAVNESSHASNRQNHATNPSSSKRNKKKQTGTPKQSYKIVFMSSSGQLKDLTQQQVRQLVKNSTKLQSYLSNPDTIPQQEITQAQGQTWQKVATKVLTSVWKQKGAFWFHQPVDPVKFNIMDYFDIISKPMDLGLVKKKLSHNVYESANQFVDDIRLVFANCYRYNGDAHDISRCAKEVQGVFEENLKSTGLMKYLS